MFKYLVFLVFLWTPSLAAPPDQRPLIPIGQSPLQGDDADTQGEAPRKLQGRFLHISDIHPDKFYREGSSSDGSHPCHSGSGSAGYYGAEKSDCDSPFTLVNATFDWIGENLKDKIDYVVWTGDSARHDNDEDIPRTEKQVIQLNEFVVEKFVEVFGKPDNIDDPDPTNDFVVPIVPTFGNNDILPHNIFRQGPNRWTKRYSSIWRKFVPEAQRHSFERGGWFFTEVIPNKLAVVSLNTLYFFENNAAVDGCNRKSEPGFEHMEWLRIQLQLLRDRGMKAILIGHVPPARTSGKQSWYESCWQKYTIWVKQYRDVIVGSVYGHMNIDHFMIQDTKDLDQYYVTGKAAQGTKQIDVLPAKSDSTFTIQGSTDYLNDLRDEWADLPSPPVGFSSASAGSSERMGADANKKRQKYLDKIGGEWAERFSVSLVSPSVVPNYFPAIRVVEYNVSGLEDTLPIPKDNSSPAEVILDSEYFEAQDAETVKIAKKKNKKNKKKKGKGKKKPKFKVPKGPSKSSPPGPAYSPQTFSFLSYTQYFANLTHINSREPESGSTVAAGAKNSPKKFEFEVEYDTMNDTTYKMDDLTVRSYLDLAMRISRKKGPKSSLLENAADRNFHVGAEEDDVEFEIRKHKKGSKKHKKKKGKHGSEKQNKVWMTFVERAYVGTKTQDEIEEGFG
ncbi:MAG: hypothetical protein Q9160_004695 [Pyrenula sp. 1 TL-2023]